MEMRSMGLYLTTFKMWIRQNSTPEKKSLYSISLHDQRTTTTSLLNGEHVKKKKRYYSPFNLVMAKSMGPEVPQRMENLLHQKWKHQTLNFLPDVSELNGPDVNFIPFLLFLISNVLKVTTSPWVQINFASTKLSACRSEEIFLSK